MLDARRYHFVACGAFVFDLLDFRHGNCMVDSGSSARATQPFPFNTRRGASASLGVLFVLIGGTIASHDAALTR